MLFAAEEPLDATSIAERLPRDIEVEAVLEAVRAKYEQGRISSVKIDKKYAFRSALTYRMFTKARGSAAPAFQGGARNAGDYRLSPAGDARRD